jgi:hypothetical protein
MIVKAADQGKREFCIALFNRFLHKTNRCPANHEVDYANGWFYLDGKKFHRPELTVEADQLMRAGATVFFWNEGNTFVLGDR